MGAEKLSDLEIRGVSSERRRRDGRLLSAALRDL